MVSGDRAVAPRITPVILSGGSGTRLWPLSRKSRPKQMLSLLGERTMLQRTADRAADASLFNLPIVVAAAAHADAVEAQVGTDVRLILEPCPRNTAPAIALAALASDPDALLLVMPSDHIIGKPDRFIAAVEAALPLAEQGWLITFGVKPTRPETGFGYIKRAEELSPGVFRAARFLEKPDAATAEAFLKQGGFDWNGGIFLFKASAYLKALTDHAPEMLEAVQRAMPEAAASFGRISPDGELFNLVRGNSIDRSVMELAGNVAVAPIDVDWSDVGSWEALHEASEKDGEGNALVGNVEMLSSTDCLVRSEGPRVVAIGVKGLAIVATPDTVLVVPLDQSQRVSEAVARLAARGYDGI